MTLHTRQLVVFYAYLAAAAALPLSFFSHYVMSDTLAQIGLGGGAESAQWFAHKHLATWLPFASDFSLATRAIFLNYVVQALLGLLLGSILNFHYASPRNNPNLLLKSLIVSMLSPNFFAMSGLPSDAVDLTVALSLLLPGALTAYALWSVIGRAVVAVMQNVKAKRQFVANFGLNTFLETEWQRIRVPALLRTFWITRVGIHLCGELLKTYNVAATAAESSMPRYDFTDGSIVSPYSTAFLGEQLQFLCRDLVTRGSETLLALLGMTSIVGTLCHYVGAFFHYLLRQQDHEEEKSVASVSAVLFFVLALQTGLTSLEPDKRFTRLCKNLCLLFTALFHFIHNIVSPVLMSLSASRNYRSRRRLRALAICAFLVVAPVALMTYLWGAFSVGTWLLAVSAFCVEVIVKVTVTVCVYLLFLYDQWYKEGTWEMLDDSVYYVKAVGNSVEFCFAVFLFFNGGWILLFESGGTIRAVMMLIHAYCNIWCEAKAGWNTFIKRRSAVTKINCLPEATAEQLERNADVCAICYQNMETAKMTRCNHFFHGVCLRKWLYVQDTCPLCHTPLYKTPQEQQQQRQEPQQAGAAGDGELQQRRHPLPDGAPMTPPPPPIVRRRRHVAVAAGADGEVQQVAVDELIDNDVVESGSSSGSSSDDGSDDDDDGSDIGRVVVEPGPPSSSSSSSNRALSSSSSSSEDDRPEMDLIYDSMEEFDVIEDDDMDAGGGGRRARWAPLRRVLNNGDDGAGPAGDDDEADAVIGQYIN